MRLNVNEQCIGCRLCNKISPAVFSINEFGSAEAIRSEIGDEYITDALMAMDNCPALAIEEIV